jgi:hypothetical protein
MVYGLGEVVEDHAGSLGGRARIRAAPGWWHGYLLRDENGADLGYALLHESDAARAWRGLEPSLRVMVEGGTLSILDGAVLEDPDLGVDEVDRLRRADPYGDRGVYFGTGGDGEHEVLCRGPKSGRTAIVVRF